MRWISSWILSGVLLLVSPPLTADELEVVVTLQNLTADEVSISSVWVGFQNGEFDLYDPESGPSEELLRLLKYGDSSPLEERFVASGRGEVSAALPIGVQGLSPGERTSRVFSLDPEAAESHYLVFAASLSSSRELFIASESPVAHPVFDESGAFTGTSFLITANEALSFGKGTTDLEISGKVDAFSGGLYGAPEEGETPPLPPEEELGTETVEPSRTRPFASFELARITVRTLPSSEAELSPAPTTEVLTLTGPDVYGKRPGIDLGPDLGPDQQSEAVLDAEESETVEGLDLDRWSRFSETLEGDGEEEDGFSEASQGVLGESSEDGEEPILAELSEEELGLVESPEGADELGLVDDLELSLADDFEEWSLTEPDEEELDSWFVDEDAADGEADEADEADEEI